MIQQILWVVGRVLTWPIRAIDEIITLRAAIHARIAGVTIYNAYDPDLSERLFHNVASALELLEAYEPRWARRLRDHVPRIVVDIGRSGYLRPSRSIKLSASLVLKQESIVVASVLVHEAVHARLHGRGIRSWPNVKARIEQACLRQQIDFLRRLSGVEHYVKHYEQFIDQSWWDGAAAPVIDSDELRRLGFPNWLVTIAVTVQSWRSGRRSV